MIDSCICIEVDEPNDLEKVKHVIGRKEHRCCECRRAIPKGTRHEVLTILKDERWETWRTCQLCEAVRKDFMQCGYYIGQVWDHINEYNYRDGDGDIWDPPAADPLFLEETP